jgi:hypothetical protein
MGPTITDLCAYRLTITIRASGQDLTQFIDLLSTIRGRAEIQATFQDVNQPVGDALELSLMTAMIRRLPG